MLVRIHSLQPTTLGASKINVEYPGRGTRRIEDKMALGLAWIVDSIRKRKDNIAPVWGRDSPSKSSLLLSAFGRSPRRGEILVVRS